MKKHSLKQILVIPAILSALFFLAAKGPAPLRGDKLGITPHTNLQKQDEKTLESEQQVKVIGEQGHVQLSPQDTGINLPADTGDAKSVLAQAANAQDSSSAQAKQVLSAAEERLGPQRSTGWIWAFGILAVIACGLFGLKRWADQNIPSMPGAGPSRKSNW